MENERIIGASLLIMLSFMGTVAYRITLPVASFYVKQTLGMTAFAVGLLTTSFYILRAMSALGTGYFSETARRGKLLATIAFGLQILVTYYLILKPEYLGVVLIRALQGILNGFAWTSVQILLAGSVPERYRGRIFAVYAMSGSLGSLIGDFFYKLYGNHALLFSIFFYVISSAIVYVAGGIAEDTSKGKPLLRSTKKAKKRNEKRIPVAFLLISVMAISYTTVMSVGDIAYVYYKGILGLSKGSTALLRGASSFAGTLIAFFLGWLADKGEAKKVLIGAYMTSILGTIFISVPTITLAILGIATITVSSRIFVPIARKVASEMPRGNIYIGFLGTLGNIGAALGGTGFGYLYTVLDSRKLTFIGLSFAEAPLIATLWLYLVPLILFAGMRRQKNDQPA